MATMMTSTILITERLEGVWDRTLVAGATAAEILLAHVVTQSIIMAFQILEMLLICFGAFRAEVVGSLAEVVGIMFVLGLSGMCYGK